MKTLLNAIGGALLTNMVLAQMVFAAPLTGNIGFTGIYSTIPATNDLTKVVSCLIYTVSISSTSGVFVGATNPTFVGTIPVNSAAINQLTNSQLWSVTVGSNVYRLVVNSAAETQDTPVALAIQGTGTLTNDASDNASGTWQLSFGLPVPPYRWSSTFLLPPSYDLAASSLSWSTTNSGCDFSYTNLGSPLASSTTAKLFWANGTNIANAYTNVPVFSTNIPAGFTGQAIVHVPESYFRSPWSNATYLQFVLDPNNLIAETTKTNNLLAIRNTFRHVVLVMMENRSFDHFLGWLPGAEGLQLGMTYTNASGQSFTNWHLTYFQGCGCDDPDHSYTGGRIEFNNGGCDGWLLANTNDTYSIGYYNQNDLPFLGQVTTNWTVCDHYFAAIMAETQPNRIYQNSAQTDSLTNRQILRASLPQRQERIV